MPEPRPFVYVPVSSTSFGTIDDLASRADSTRTRYDAAALAPITFESLQASVQRILNASDDNDNG